MIRDELRLLALSYRNIDWLLNARSRSKSTLENRAKRMRRKGKQAV